MVAGFRWRGGLDGDLAGEADLEGEAGWQSVDSCDVEGSGRWCGMAVLIAS
jgi:hypothetical protein